MTRRELLVLLGAAPAGLTAAGRAAWYLETTPRKVFGPDREWEGTCAMPFSGGLVRDARGRLRLYYLSNFHDLSLAVSDDEGLTWRKPDLGLGHNIVARTTGADAYSVCARDGGAGGYFAMSTSPGLGRPRFSDSEDGLTWRPQSGPPGLEIGDRSSLVYFRGAWLVFARTGGGTGNDPRRFSLYRATTFPQFTRVEEDWLRCDDLDGTSEYSGGPVQLYGVDLVGGTGGNKLALTVWRGQMPGRPKLCDVQLAVLRDDLTVLRDPQRVVVAAPGPAGSWCYGNVQGVGGGTFQTPDGRWRMLVSGRAGDGTGGHGVCATGVVDL